MGKTRRSRDAGLKAKVAFEVASGFKTIAQIASEYGLHPKQVGQWKKKLLEGLPEIFMDKRAISRKRTRRS